VVGQFLNEDSSRYETATPFFVCGVGQSSERKNSLGDLQNAWAAINNWLDFVFICGRHHVRGRRKLLCTKIPRPFLLFFSACPSTTTTTTSRTTTTNLVNSTSVAKLSISGRSFELSSTANVALHPASIPASNFGPLPAAVSCNAVKVPFHTAHARPRPTARLFSTTNFGLRISTSAIFWWPRAIPCPRYAN